MVSIIDSTQFYKMDFDLEEFLSFVENAILSIPLYCERENDIRGMLLQSQLLVRDVVSIAFSTHE